MSSPRPPFAPPQASDPAVLPGGRIVPRYVPPPAGSDQFRIDLERAPQAIRELEVALEQLRVLRNDAMALGRVVPPTQDQVSLDAASILGATAVGGTGSFLGALDSGILQVEHLIAGLREDIEKYRTVDQSATDDLS